MAQKTSVDEDHPDKDDAMVAIIGTGMVLEATSIVMKFDVDLDKWPDLLMRAMVFILDRGEDYSGPNPPTVAKMRDLCDLHLKRKGQ